MDPISAIAGAIVSGAIAVSSDVAGQAVRDSYAALKKILVDGYHLVTLSLAESDPTKDGLARTVEAELAMHREAVTNPGLLKAVEALQEALRTEPPERLARWGVDIGRIEAGRDIILEQINDTRIGEAKAAQDFRLTGSNLGNL